MNNIIKEFRESKAKLDSLKTSLLSLLPTLINENSEDFSIHQIVGRIKSQDSLEEKIKRKEGKYSNLSEITDVVGIRIITYLESDVDIVARIIENEFIKDEINSVDKRKRAVNEIGYRSLHFVVSMSDQRNSMTEYKTYGGIKFEIQIRSILQHAWAEIEHDLGYKNKSTSGIPEHLKRDFNLLAAALEIADQKFDNLKKEITQYIVEVPNMIHETPATVDINNFSLTALNNENSILIEARSIIAIRSHRIISNEPNFVSSSIAEYIKYLGFKSILEVENSLIENGSQYHEILPYFSNVFNWYRQRELPKDIALLYFCHLLIMKSQDFEKIKSYAFAGGFGDLSHSIAESFITVFKHFIEMEAKKID